MCIVGLGRDGQQRAHSCSVLCSVRIGLGLDGIWYGAWHVALRWLVAEDIWLSSGVWVWSRCQVTVLCSIDMLATPAYVGFRADGWHKNAASAIGLALIPSYRQPSGLQIS